MRLRTTVGLLLVCLPTEAFAATTEIGPGDNLQQAVDALVAGDELVLQGGTRCWRQHTRRGRRLQRNCA